MDLLVDMPVRDAAALLDVTPHRVRALVHNGAIHAVKQGRDLRLSRRDVQRIAARPSVPGRPYSAEGAWRRLRDLDSSNEPRSVLVARLAGRSKRLPLTTHPSLLDRLADDSRLLLSGHAAAEGLPLFEDPVVEAYLDEAALPAVVAEYRLRAPERTANVILRPVPSHVELPEVVPPIVIALDLLDSPLPRVRGIGQAMLGELL